MKRVLKSQPPETLTAYTAIPNASSCAEVVFIDNNFASTFELVASTIEMLNLNCRRLSERRHLLFLDTEHLKAKLRQQGLTPSEAYTKLIDRYFGHDFPEFFTTLRCCLGSYGEAYLKSIGFEG